MEVFKEEEQRIQKILSGLQAPTQLHPILMQEWERGTFWFSLALDSPTALFTIFYDYIQPRFSKTHKDNDDFLADHHALLEI